MEPHQGRVVGGGEEREGAVGDVQVETVLAQAAESGGGGAVQAVGRVELSPPLLTLSDLTPRWPGKKSAR